MIILLSFHRQEFLSYKKVNLKDFITVITRHPYSNYDSKKFTRSFVNTSPTTIRVSLVLSLSFKSVFLANLCIK